MQESEEQLQASGKPPPHGLNRVLAATLSSTAPNRLLLGERLAAEVSATSSVQMARHSLTSATYTQLRLSSPITRIVTVRGGRQPRTHKQPCPVLSIALDPPSFKLRLAFCEKLPKHLSPSFRCWEGTLPTRFGVGSSGDMIFALASVNVLLSYSSALPEAGSELAFNSSAWTSPCSTLISVGSVRELPEPTKVELSLLITAVVFICGRVPRALYSRSRCRRYRPTAIDSQKKKQLEQIHTAVTSMQNDVKKQCLEQMIAQNAFSSSNSNSPNPLVAAQSLNEEEARLSTCCGGKVRLGVSVAL